MRTKLDRLETCKSQDNGIAYCSIAGRRALLLYGKLGVGTSVDIASELGVRFERTAPIMGSKEPFVR